MNKPISDLVITTQSTKRYNMRVIYYIHSNSYLTCSHIFYYPLNNIIYNILYGVLSVLCGTRGWGLI